MSKLHSAAWDKRTYLNGDVKISFCEVCKFYHQFPAPDADEVNSRYFVDEPYDDAWLEKEKLEHLKGLWWSLYDQQIRTMRSVMQSAGIGDINSILDIGCGAGWFGYRVIDHHHIIVYGIEPSSKARQASELPLKVYPYANMNMLDNDDALKLPFDIIRFSLVLEHVPDPLQTLKDASKYLRNGGVLQVIVPNEMNSLQKRVKGNWWITPYHVNYFTPQSLRDLLYKAGFCTVYETSNRFPTELWIMLGLDHRNNKKIGTATHNIQLRFEQTFGRLAFKLYKKLYDKWGIGRELQFTAVKK